MPMTRPAGHGAPTAGAVGNPATSSSDGGTGAESSSVVVSVTSSDSGTGADSSTTSAGQSTYLGTITARSGLIWAGLFDGVSTADASGGGHAITWAAGTPGTRSSPIPNDPKLAADLANSNVGVIAHFAALDRGNGPWAIEFWCTGHDQNSVLFSLTDDTSTGWAIQSTAGIMQLTGPTTVVNIQSSAASAAGWHHFVVSRGSGGNGHVYVDGVDRTAAVNAMTFASTTQQFELLANGGLYGVAVYSRELTASEAIASATYVYPPSGGGGGGGGLPTIEGWGANALSTLGTETYTVSNLGSSGAGSFMGALAWLNAGHQGTISITVSGSVALPQQMIDVYSAANFFIDGRGGNITLSGGTIFFHDCHHFAIANIRHRGNWTTAPDQAGDCFTIGAGHDYALLNVSISGFSDEGLDIAYPSYNISVVDCLWYRGMGTLGSQSDHNFGGGIGCYTTRVSMIRPTYVDVLYRTPRVEYWSTNGPVPSQNSPCWNGSNFDGGAPPYMVCDLVNPVYVDVPVVGVNYGRGQTNVRNPYLQNSGSGFAGSGLYAPSVYHVSWDVATGSSSADWSFSAGFAVAGYANPTVMTATAAKDYAKTHAGCLPHDATDTSILGRIT